CRLSGKRAVEHSDGGCHVAGRRHVRVVRQVLSEPRMTLCVRDGVRSDDLHIVERRAMRGDEHEVHAYEVLADDAQTWNGRQRVLRGGNAALDGVLDSDHRRVTAPLEHVGERLAHVVHRAPMLTSCFGHLIQCCFGERSEERRVGIVYRVRFALYLYYFYSIV